MFHILDPNKPENFLYLSKMHNLRYKVFYQNLGWRTGLQVHSQMEFDQYDHEDAKYLIRVNQNDEVDACARLTPTNKPYLLGHSFNDYIQEESIPNSDKIYEISRLCANPLTAPRKITGHLMAAMLEYALENDIETYVSLSDVKIIPVVKRFGWQSCTIGPFMNTGTDISVALKYNVTEEFHENVKRIVEIDGSSYRATNQELNLEQSANNNVPHLRSRC